MTQSPEVRIFDGGENGVRGKNGVSIIEREVIVSGYGHREARGCGGYDLSLPNRANFRARLFRTDAHYEDFLGIVEEALAFVPMRILAYCLMPNHWHLVVHPRADGDLARFLQRLTMTHTQRYHARTGTVGYGHLYQGRYKSLPVESDSHFLALVRYVERNAQRAALVKKAEDWPWSSVHVQVYGNAEQKKILRARSADHRLCAPRLSGS